MLQKPRTFLAKTPLIVRVFALYVLTAAVLIPAWAMSRPVQVAIDNPPYVPPAIYGQAQQVITGIPDRVIVERLGVDLPVREGTYNAETGEWTLSDDAAFFATMTDPANDYRGNTFIYAHDREGLFGPLEGIQAGDTVKVHTSNGHTFTYAYSRDATVNPDVTDILYADPETPQLTLMTCDGIFSEVRRIMFFDLVEVSS